MSKPTKLELPNGDVYKLMVLEVIESDGKGARTFRRLHEDESINIKDGMKFWIVYANESVLDEKFN